MKRIIIFGAGNLGSVLASELSINHEIIGFIDNNCELWGKTVAGYKVLGGTGKINELDYDEIVIASTMRFDEIRNELIKQGIGDEKLNHEIQNRLLVEVQARVNFLRDFSKLADKYDEGAAVAEGGVFQGMFSREINNSFPDRTLYLFDTFEGFHRKDVETEAENSFSKVKEHYYSETSEELVLNRLPHKDKAIIRKGYFPDTAIGLENEKFLFVNLDFDLYNPILAGLRFFYPRMVTGGVILIHDYFTEFYHGVRKALEDFEKEESLNLIKAPIGDGISIAIYIQ